MRLRALGAALAATLIVASSVLAAVADAGATHKQRPRLTVFAAASLTSVFPQIDSRARYSFGGSCPWRRSSGCAARARST